MIRAVTYIRVSTEEEKQLNAFAKQREEAKLAVKQQGWEFVREYSDEGKSGTNTKHRDGYRQLFEDLASDTFDVVVIKSQDRLMRNVKDWYLFVSRMIDNGKKMYMYLENRFYQTDDSLITGIKAILAEEYSRDLSKKLLNSNRHRQESGRTIISNGTIWGYDQVDGNLIVNEEEAKVVRRVFDLYVQGYGTRKIKNILDSEGVLSKRGTKIGVSTLKRMIKNPLYIGTVTMNKRHFDFDTKRYISLPEEQWILHEHRVEPIIDEETFKLANKIKKLNTVEHTGVMRGINRGTYPMSGKIVCGLCGKHYRRTSYNTQQGRKYWWICGTYQEYGKMHPQKRGAPIRVNGCDGKCLQETLINDIIASVAGDTSELFITSFDNIMKHMRDMIQADDYDGKISALKCKINNEILRQNTLLDKLLDGTVSNALYAEKERKIKDKIAEYQAEIDALEAKKISTQDIDKQIEDIKSAIMSGEDEIRRHYVENHIETMTVYQDHADVVVNLFGNAQLQVVSFDGLQRAHLEKNGYRIVTIII